MSIEKAGKKSGGRRYVVEISYFGLSLFLTSVHSIPFCLWLLTVTLETAETGDIVEEGKLEARGINGSVYVIYYYPSISF